MSIAGALALVGIAQSALAQTCAGRDAPGAATLTVEATGLRSSRGEVAFTVYANDRKKFLAKGGKLLRIRVPAAAPVTRGCFLLPPGRYAVTQYHDENGDRNFNRTLFIPKEGAGASNDVASGLRGPALADTLFAVPAGRTTMRMMMRYKR